MALKLYSETAIQDIADAIRAKNGSSDKYKVSDMASAISEISGGGNQLTKLDEINVSANVRSVAISTKSEWFNYDFLIFKWDLTLSASDWVYFSGQETSGGVYTTQLNKILTCSSMSKLSNGNFQGAIPFPSGNNGIITISSNYTLYVYTYSASKTIQSGSKITVYGGYNADL